MPFPFPLHILSMNDRSGDSPRAARRSAKGKAVDETDKPIARPAPVPPTPAARAALMRGLASHKAGDLSGAETAYREAAAAAPGWADPLVNLGAALRSQGRKPERLDVLQRAVDIAPDNADALNNYGNALRDAGRLDEAIEAYRRGLVGKPRAPDLHENLATALLEKKEFAQAIELLGNAVKLAPDRASAWHFLAAALFSAEKWEAAIVAYGRAVALKRDNAEAWFGLGVALETTNRFDEALRALGRALVLNPNHGKALRHYSQVLVSLGDLAGGLSLIDEAVAKGGSGNDAELVRARASLLARDFTIGWPAYEARWSRVTDQKPPEFPFPRWQGEDLNGKTIVVWAEQGVGDVVNFSRVLPRLAARGARVAFVCAPEIAPVIEAGMRGVAKVMAAPAKIGRADFHVPLLSVPGLLGPPWEPGPHEVPYLKVPAGRKLPEALAQAPAGIKIGFTWAGNPKHGNDKRRSVRLERFLPPMDIPGLQWFSPQVGDAPRAQIAELGAEPLFIDLAPDLKDFGDTAAALAALDLLVSVDTAPVHLAGALARPVWVLMPFAPDWRWRLHRADTPWYPTMRLVRQPKVGDWDSVFETVRIDLLALAGKKRR